MSSGSSSPKDTGKATSTEGENNNNEAVVELDLSQVTEADFPEKVSLKVPFVITNSTGIEMNLKAGNKIKPISLEGTMLIFQPVGLPVQSRINVDKTDFRELTKPNVVARLANPQPATDPEPMPDTTPQPDPAPTPDPEPVPQPDTEIARIGNDAVVNLMKQSIADGSVTEFTAEQVTEWSAGENVEHLGKTYQTGQASFTVETIIGSQKRVAVALIENGKVAKWLWANTPLEIR